mmetsp:Transcript_61767/g.146017  ORF Transcript_61767/g.146017 Transcript_61767/m.146017 type:complete len:88 (-) Transcript_61767:1497-1760(-)
MLGQSSLEMIVEKPDVTHTPCDVPIPTPSFPRVDVSDVHSVASFAVPPTRTRLLTSKDPIPSPNTVKLTDPDTAPFVRTTSLACGNV